MRRIVWSATVIGLVIAGSGSAAAQSMRAFSGYLTGSVGTVVGGDVTSSALTPGASVSVQESDGWGAEFDFGYSADVDSGAQELDIATYTVNVNWILPQGRLRPYTLAGAGVLQIDGCNVPCNRPSKTYDFGLSAGGGVIMALRETVGFRGDVRYFWTAADHPDLQRPDNFGFWRASVGITFMWTVLP